MCHVATKRRPRHFHVAEGEVLSGPRHATAADATELYLARMSRIEPFDQVFQHLTKMTFCNPNVDRIRELQALDGGQLLKRDGSNLASVLRRLDTEAPEWKSAVDEYLHAIAPQIVRVEPRGLGPKMTLQFVLQATPNRRDDVTRKRRFLAENMSDGTLRAVAVLVAMLQFGGSGDHASLVGIEEPELSLHPGPLGTLTDAALESSESLQILLTTHSVELLDNEELPYDSIFPVEFTAGRSRIGTLDDACVAAIERGDFTVGELLRMGQASPRFSPRQRRSLFPRPPKTA